MSDRPVFWLRLGSNSLANVLVGASAIAFQLGLVYLAARAFDPPTFAVWTLAVSMAGLTPLFAFNLSAVITRQLVSVLRDADRTLAANVMTAARSLSRVLGAIALMTIVILAAGLHRYSPELRDSGLGEFVLAALLLAASQLWQITIHPTLAWHYAREDNWPAVWAFFFTRVGALGAMWVATHTLAGGLLLAACALAVGHWVGIGVAYLGRFRPQIASVPASAVLRAQGSETVVMLRWFAIWSLCLAGSQYGLPQIVSLLGGSDYNAFYLAFTLNLVLSGIVGAIGSAMLAPVTRIGNSGDHRALVQILTAVPTGMAVLLVCALGLMHAGMPLFVEHWSYSIADPVTVNSYLVLLGFQTVARWLASVFGIVLAAHATALRLIGPPLLEIALMLFVAVPIGVAMGPRAFLICLSGTALAAALTTVVISVHVAGLGKSDRRRVVLRFLLIEAVALGSWWILAN